MVISDIVVLDLVMPEAGGFTALRTFGQSRPSLAVIVLSSSENPADVRRALSMGALGFVPKSANPTTLLSAIKLVIGGDLYIPPLILDQTLRHGPTRIAGGDTTGDALTRRQIDVLRLLSRGLANKSIAAELDLSEKTVKAHITAIFKALDVVKRTQAVNAARDAGLI